MKPVEYQHINELLVHTEPAGDCLEWGRGRTDKGYGVASHRGKQYRAHRLAWSLVNGDIPDGMVIRHTCDNPPCINPAHLICGTQADNIADKFARQRHPGCGKHERTQETRSRASQSAKRRWERMTQQEREAMSTAMSVSRIGRKRGPYKGRTEYAGGYKPSA